MQPCLRWREIGSISSQSNLEILGSPALTIDSWNGKLNTRKTLSKGFLNEKTGSGIGFTHSSFTFAGDSFESV